MLSFRLSRRGADVDGLGALLGFLLVGCVNVLAWATRIGRRRTGLGDWSLGRCCAALESGTCGLRWIWLCRRRGRRAGSRGRGTDSGGGVQPEDSEKEVLMLKRGRLAVIESVWGHAGACVVARW